MGQGFQFAHYNVMLFQDNQGIDQRTGLLSGRHQQRGFAGTCSDTSIGWRANDNKACHIGLLIGKILRDRL